VVLAQGVASGQAMAAGIDQEAGGAMATDHLLGLGHEHVAHVTGPLDWIEAGQRRAGWQQAHERRRRLPGPELAGDWSARSGYEAGLRIAEDPSVTAVFAANDAMALGLLRALQQHGRRVPEDVSVVGFDDVPEAEYLWPALTTVNQELDRLGQLAVDLTLRALRGEESPTERLLTPTLLVRESTAAPR
jgi:DNA-binding LacI/PurR family transcriptional regulator